MFVASDSSLTDHIGKGFLAKFIQYQQENYMNTHEIIISTVRAKTKLPKNLVLKLPKQLTTQSVNVPIWCYFPHFMMNTTNFPLRQT